MASDTRKADGAFDFSLGVDSGRVPTVQSQLTPHGLPRNALAWAYNATCRSGAVSPRPGFTKLGRVAGPGCGLYQSGYLYDASALDPARKPYLMLSVGGRILQVRVDTDNSVVDLSAMSGLTNPAGITQGFMCQGEEFLVIQAGDYTTLPLFWDGAAMRRSTGILNTTALPGGTFTVPAIGAPVLVTVATSYGGVLNQRFTIGGYHYIQIDRNQVYTVAGFSSNAADALKTFTVIANSVWADAPDAKFLLDYTNTFGAGPLPPFAAATCYCESTALNVFPYGPILIPGVAGNVTAQFVADGRIGPLPEIPQSGDEAAYAFHRVIEQVAVERDDRAFSGGAVGPLHDGLQGVGGRVCRYPFCARHRHRELIDRLGREHGQLPLPHRGVQVGRMGKSGDAS